MHTETPWYKLFDYIVKKPETEYLSYFIKLYPEIEVNIEDSTFFIRNQFITGNFDKSPQCTGFLDYSSFPDESYQWIEYNEVYEYDDVLWGTYYFQNIIWEHQHPSSSTCDELQYLIIGDYDSSFGFEITVLTSYLALAEKYNRIAIWSPFIYSKYTNITFCKEQSFSCFFHSLSSCELNKEEYIKWINHEKSIYNHQISIIHNKQDIYDHMDKRIWYVSNTLEFRNTIPQYIRKFYNVTNVPRSYYIQYWRIQAITYMLRPTHDVLEWIRIFTNTNYTGDPMNTHNDICVHIYHNPRNLNEKLVENYNYLSSIQLLEKIKHSRNASIFLNTNDPGSLSYFFRMTSLNIHYNKYPRSLCLERNHTLNRSIYPLIELANLKTSLDCFDSISTSINSWQRIIQSLRITVGMRSSSYYIDIGDLPCLNDQHCKLIHKQYEYIYW
ncbi:hypothetical protein WA158_006275 [Blastocystis sp. Blastoise]